VKNPKSSALSIASVMPDEKGGIINCEYGVTETVINNYKNRGDRSRLAQLIEIVFLGMATPAHIFKGLRRPMKVGRNGHADRDFLVYCWLPERDCEFNIQTKAVQYLQVSMNQVFVTIVQPYTEPVHGMRGEVVRWYWLDEDNHLALAHMNYQGRYNQHVWNANIV
jgi:hypothetical protein